MHEAVYMYVTDCTDLARTLLEIATQCGHPQPKSNRLICLWLTGSVDSKYEIRAPAISRASQATLRQYSTVGGDTIMRMSSRMGGDKLDRAQLRPRWRRGRTPQAKDDTIVDLEI